MYTLQQIAKITGSQFTGPHNHFISNFLNDSRNIQQPAESIFIAIRSYRNDGHNYVGQLIKNGIRSFIIETGILNPVDFPEASFVVSENPLRTIQLLAEYHRAQFNIPVIGITGSNGKTVVKEWLYQSLKDKYTICRSPKSYNSQIGVPLSVLNLNSSHTLAVFEAGISKVGEMKTLQRIIQPTIGVFTSLGSAHDEGFSSPSEKVAEKFLLFENCSQIIVNGIDKDLVPENYKQKSIFAIETAVSSSLKTGFIDEASKENAITVAAVLENFGLTFSEISARVNNLQPVALRLEIKSAVNNSLVINDYYNSDLDSVRIALNYLQQQNRKSKKVVIISDIEQSGISSSLLYKQISELFNINRIDLLIGIGSGISKHRSYFKSNSLFFDDTQDFLSSFRTFDFHLHSSTILLKGARSFGFEAISRILQQKSHDTVFEVHLDRLIENINYYRAILGKNVSLMCMVKAMGYGSGGAEIARTLEHAGVSYLAVAYADEGVELRQSLITLPVMVMNPEEEAYDDIINYQLEPEIYSFKTLRSFASKLDQYGIIEPYPVHIKVDTGMRRLGFENFELDDLVSEILSLSNIKVKSVFSHLAGSDNPSLDEFTLQQKSLFEVAAAKIETKLGYPVIKHLANSAAISRFKAAHFDMVRLGIGMYGLGVDGAEQKKLQTVGVLKSKISQIKRVNKGETVGYNRNGKIVMDATIAIVPIGYADGFSRLLGNGKHGVYIKNQFCKTVGNICMDMCMIDVSDIKCSEGDEVIIFENAKQINELALALNTIAYEVLTNVSARVKRVYLQE